MNPYLIDGPTCISFSGGRTSAFLLHRLLQENDGLPENTYVCFSNTGKEEEATLKFVNECAIKWNIKINWLEYRYQNSEVSFKVVDFKTASRKGEPFDQVILKREPSLPNGRSRYCSSELKTRTMHRFLKAEGLKEWDTFLGIRADEPKRAYKFRTNPHPEGKHETVCLPLVIDGISSFAVGEFWKAQSFDLELPNHNGKTMHGNCDLCMLKPKSQILSLITENPERAAWWIKKEEEAEKRCSGDGKFFAIDRPSYKKMLDFSKQQIDIFDKNEEAISCFCGD